MNELTLYGCNQYDRIRILPNGSKVGVTWKKEFDEAKGIEKRTTISELMDSRNHRLNIKNRELTIINKKPDVTVKKLVIRQPFDSKNKYDEGIIQLTKDIFIKGNKKKVTRVSLYENLASSCWFIRENNYYAENNAFFLCSKLVKRVAKYMK